MKKRTMAFGGLLTAVAMTAYSVSGTYAKYVSSIDITDEARVAKWGFTTKINGNAATEDMDINLFARSYKLNPTGTEYVKALDNNDNNVIAPGTTGEFKFEIDGSTIETAFRFKFEVDKFKDIIVSYKIDDGKILNPELITPEQVEAKRNDGNYIYYPIKYTLTRNYIGDNNTEEIVAPNMTSAQALAYLLQYNDDASKVNYPGSNTTKRGYTISWKWNTESVVEGEIPRTTNIVDQLDTWLGENTSLNGAYTDKANAPVQFSVRVIAEQVAENYSSVDGN